MGQLSFVDLENREIPSACQLVQWGHYVGWNWLSVASNGDSDIPITGQHFSISDNMERRDDPPIRIDNEPGPVHNVSVNLDYGVQKPLASFDLGNWMRDNLWLRCANQQQNNESAFHDGYPRIE